MTSTAARKRLTQLSSDSAMDRTGTAALSVQQSRGIQLGQYGELSLHFHTPGQTEHLPT